MIASEGNHQRESGSGVGALGFVVDLVGELQRRVALRCRLVEVMFEQGDPAQTPVTPTEEVGVVRPPE